MTKWDGKSRPVNDKYRKGYDAIFGKKRPKEIGGNKAIGQRSKAIFADIVGSANDNDDIQITANIGSFKAGERTSVKFNTSGIQNRQIRLKKDIDRINARFP